MMKRIRRLSFPPGEHISEELEARGWTQGYLAEIMGHQPHDIDDIICGRGAITPQTAVELGAAFGTSSEIWLNIEMSYRCKPQEAS